MTEVQRSEWLMKLAERRVKGMSKRNQSRFGAVAKRLGERIKKAVAVEAQAKKV